MKMKPTREFLIYGRVVSMFVMFVMAAGAVYSSDPAGITIIESILFWVVAVVQLVIIVDYRNSILNR